MEKGTEEGPQQGGLTSLVHSWVGFLWSVPDYPEIRIDDIIWSMQSGRVEQKAFFLLKYLIDLGKKYQN